MKLDNKTVQIIGGVILSALTIVANARAGNANAKAEQKVDNATVLIAIANITNRQDAVESQLRTTNANIEKQNDNIQRILQEMERGREAERNIKARQDRLENRMNGTL